MHMCVRSLGVHPKVGGMYTDSAAAVHQRLRCPRSRDLREADRRPVRVTGIGRLHLREDPLDGAVRR